MRKHNFAFEAIGTAWQIETTSELSDALKETILARIEAFDHTYSRFRDDSLVNELREKPGVYTFPTDSITLIHFYRQLYGMTEGKVTPLIGATLEKAGYDASYRLTPEKQIALPSWDTAMIWDNTTVTTHQPITLDVGAAGKGYLIDILSALLEAEHIREYVIDGSGDLLHRGSLENRVGLEDPRDPSAIIGMVDVQNQSLCASASNRRAWGNGLHHIFDPTTLAPTEAIIATWVIAETTMVADGLATALFFTEPSVLAEHYAFDYVRMHKDGSLDYSTSFRGELY